MNEGIVGVLTMANFPKLVSATAKATKQKREVVDQVARAFLRQVQAAIASDGGASIYGFGKFTVRKLPERVGRDFRSGERLRVSGKDRVWFRPSHRTARMASKARHKR